MNAIRRLALVDGAVHTGEAVLNGWCVVIDNGTVVGVTPEVDADHFDGEVIDLAGRIVAPGLVDLQVNGGGDLLFNDAPTVETLATIAAAHESQGTTSLLATFVTGSDDGLQAAGTAVAAALREGVAGTIGAHFEGPLLSEAHCGVHPVSLLQSGPSDRLFELLSPPEPGLPTMVTLAPEVVPSGFIRALVHRGAVVAAGHTGAGAAAVHSAVGEGLSAVTHLWNGMPPVRGRQPGPVLSLLLDPRLRCGLIADGYHLAAETLQLSMAAAGPGRCHLVSDAMPPAGGSRSTFTLAGQTITVGDGRCLTQEGGLAGSAVPLIECVRHSASIGVPVEEALRMATVYPAQCIGVDRRLGRIVPGYPAHLIVLDPSLDLHMVIVGERVHPAPGQPSSFPEVPR